MKAYLLFSISVYLISIFGCVLDPHPSDLYYIGDPVSNLSLLGKRTYILSSAKWCVSCEQVVERSKAFNKKNTCNFLIVDADQRQVVAKNSDLEVSEDLILRQRAEFSTQRSFPTLLEYTRQGLFVSSYKGAAEIIQALEKSGC